MKCGKVGLPINTSLNTNKGDCRVSALWFSGSLSLREVSHERFQLFVTEFLGAMKICRLSQGH